MVQMQSILPPDRFCFHFCFQNHLKPLYFPPDMLIPFNMFIGLFGVFFSFFFFSLGNVDEIGIKQ